MNIDLSLVVYICAAISTIAGAVVIIGKLARKAIVSIAKESMDHSLSDFSDEFNSKLIDLTARLEEYTKNSSKADSDIKRCLLAMARDRLSQAYDIYMSKCSIDTHSMYILEELYASYKELGGNKFIDNLLEEIRELHNKTSNG